MPVSKLIKFFTTALIFLLHAAVFADDANTVDFDIPEQSLTSALRSFAEQADMQVFYSHQAVDNLNTGGLSGRYQPEAGMRKLLEKTGMSFEKSDDNTLALRAAEAAKGSGKGGGGTGGELTSGSSQQATEKEPHKQPTLGGEANSKATADFLPEIIVSATRRDENLQDVALSAYVLSNRTLEQKGVQEFIDIAREIPGLGVTSRTRGALDIGIRGIRTLTPGTGGPTVSYYLDEISTPATQLATFDLSRVEVLRGPQGTLFGEGSLGGALRFITNQPDASGFDGRVAANVADISAGESSYSVSGMVNIPLVEDSLALRVVGQYQDNGGFIDNVTAGHEEQDVDDHSLEGVRAILKWAPTSRLTITPSIIYQKDRSRLGSYESLVADPSNTLRFISLGDLEQRSTIDIDRSGEFYQPSLVLNYRFEGFEVTSSTNYYDSEDLSVNLSPGFLPSLPPAEIQFFGKSEIFTQELRLVSAKEGPIQWAAGIFYRDSEAVTDISVVALRSSASTITEVEQLAVFGTVSYRMFDKFRAEVGLRWFDESQDGTNMANFAPPLDFLSSVTERNGSKSLVTPRFSLSYDITGDAMVYASAAKGFRRGQVNLESTIPPDGDVFTDPDTLWTYELGLKSTWLSDRAYFNTAVFYTEWSDIQVSQPILIGGFTAAFVRNAGFATSQGLEIEAGWRPIHNLDVSLNTSILDAELKRDVDPAEGLFDGAELTLAPEYQVGGAVQYSYPAPIFGNASGVIRADFSFRGKQVSVYDGDLPRDQITSEPYELVNLNLGLEWEKFQFYVFCKNLFDKRAEYNFNAPATVIHRNQPRTIGFSFRANY